MAAGQGHLKRMQKCSNFLTLEIVFLISYTWAKYTRRMPHFC